MKKNQSESYKKFRLKQLTELTTYCFTLLVLLGLIVWAPNQAAQFTGYIGAFILGGSRLRGIFGL
jgi:hypothetical protein